KLKQVVDPGILIMEDRVKKRGAKLEAWRKTLDEKKAAAKSPLQKSAAAEDEARYSAEAAALKQDQDALLKQKGGPVVAEPAAEEADSPPAMELTQMDPQIAVCGDQVWLIEGRQAVAFDRASGTVKNVVRLAGQALQVFAGKGAAVIVAHAGPDAVQVTKLTASAPPQSLYLSVPAVESQDQRTEFSSGGDSLLRADILMKQAAFKTRDAIKPSSEKELESAAGNAAAHSTDEIKAIAALIENDAKRADGQHRQRVDESTYQVTLRRPFDSTAATWTGTLQGRVQFFSTPTLDLVTAGTKLLAFDRSNRKLWEATLGAPVPIREPGSASDHLPPPWLEAGERLFFADGAFLTALQPKNGAVLWRLPSVGIRKLQTDADGSLYALSDNLRVEALTYAADASLQDTVPVTMKINPADGKIAWQVDKYSDLWVSGKDVYVLRETGAGQDIENQVFDPAKAVSARMKIYKLGRKKGRPLWEWFQPRSALAAEADGKHVAILFGDEFQLIHSISW
ncbi:MAG: PQQ-binding-like beta-propeller repeat protein, partial [Chthoniobacteraceae bacterium]